MGRWVTSVASTAYNLAGDIELRPNLMKSVVVAHTLSGKKNSISETIRNSLQNGNAQKQRRFFRWAKDNYDYGLPEGSLGGEIAVDDAVVRAGLLPSLSLASNQHLILDEAFIDDGEAGFWVEAWIEQNYPDIAVDDYIFSYDYSTNEIVIEVTGHGTHRVNAHADLIWASNRNYGRQLLYVTYRIVTETATGLSNTGTVYYTYRLGSGNVSFDTLISASTDIGEFYPAIPLRIDNVAVDDSNFSGDYANIKKAYKKYMGSSIEPILETFEDHDDIGDMDHIFVVPGVALNTSEAIAQEYLYKFFNMLKDDQLSSKADFRAYENRNYDQRKANITWRRWNEGLKNSHHPLHGTTEPASPEVPGSPPLSALTIKMADMDEFNLKLSWAYIEESLHAGNARTYDGTTRSKLNPGQFWITKGSPLNISYSRSFWSGGELRTETQSVDYARVYLFEQTGRLTYKKLELCGLEHTNYVYGSHAVRMNASDALDEEEESAFLIPLHQPTVKELGLVKNNQLTTANSYVLINSAEHRKKKWYETGAFKVIVFVIGIVLAVFTAGGSLAAAGGLLGVNAAVSLALGFAVGSTIGLVVAAVVNQIAAMIIGALVMSAAKGVFGEKAGAIIGAIVSIGLSAGINGLNYGDGFMSGINSLLSPEKLLALTNAVGSAYTDWLAIDTAEIYERIDELEDTYEGKEEELQKLADSMLGMTNGELDPIMFTNIPESLGENPETFLARTLMTPSDMLEISNALIEKMPEITLDLDPAMV